MRGGIYKVALRQTRRLAHTGISPGFVHKESPAQGRAKGIAYCVGCGCGWRWRGGSIDSGRVQFLMDRDHGVGSDELLQSASCMLQNVLGRCHTGQLERRLTIETVSRCASKTLILPFVIPLAPFSVCDRTIRGLEGLLSPIWAGTNNLKPSARLSFSHRVIGQQSILENDG
jgi:hypothetical protein